MPPAVVSTCPPAPSPPAPPAPPAPAPPLIVYVAAGLIGPKISRPPLRTSPPSTIVPPLAPASLPNVTSALAALENVAPALVARSGKFGLPFAHVPPPSAIGGPPPPMSQASDCV